MNAIRTRLIRSFEQRAMHAAYLRRVEHTPRHVDTRRPHMAHHTPSIQLFVR